MCHFKCHFFLRDQAGSNSFNKVRILSQPSHPIPEKKKLLLTVVIGCREDCHSSQDLASPLAWQSGTVKWLLFVVLYAACWGGKWSYLCSPSNHRQGTTRTRQPAEADVNIQGCAAVPDSLQKPMWHTRFGHDQRGIQSAWFISHICYFSLILL